jgi:serine/threonine protein kinase
MPPTNQPTDEPTTEPTTIDTVGGRYRLGERLGHGGMGEVFAAHDLRLDRQVALKLLRADLADQDPMRERVLAEARLAARLTHPHVVGVLDTGEQDGRPYVVMERLSGRTLRDELAAGPMPAEHVRDVGLQVLRALSAAHELGIVHRDVKPGNVLDAGVGTWKVADFGIAKWLHAEETLTGTGELLGSPSYLAPERIDGQQAGPPSDLYAVGVLLYEALCGRRPFEGDDPFALAAAIRDGAYEPPSSVLPGADRGIDVVIERAMRRDPGERFGSAEEMAAALVGAEGATATTRSSTTASDDRADAAAAATVALAPMEETARLPEDAVARPPAGTPGRRRLPRASLVTAGAILAVVLITVLAIAAFTGRPDAPAPGSGADGSSLPAELEDALTRLEEAVQP